MKTIITIITLLISGGFLQSQDILDQYLQTAAQNSPALKSKFNEYMASLEKVSQVGALPDPQLAFGYFILPVETRNGPQRFKLSYSQFFPWFGTLNNREDVVNEVAKAKYEIFEEEKSKLFLEVKTSYFNLYYLDKNIDIVLDNLEILKTFRNLAIIKIESGQASAVDGIRVDMALSDMENNLSYLKDKLFAETIKFNNLLNVDSDSKVIIPDTLWTPDLLLSHQAVLDSIRLNNHQLRNFDFLYESYKHQESLARKNGTPNILLGADYINIGNNGISEQSGRDALFVRVGVTIPLFRKKYTGAINEAAFMQQATIDKKEDKINSLETIFEKAYAEYSDAVRRMELYGKQKEFARQAIAILESEYSSNGRNFEEILRMERSLLKYSIELEKAKADKQTSIAFINYLMGTDTVLPSP